METKKSPLTDKGRVSGKRYLGFCPWRECPKGNSGLPPIDRVEVGEHLASCGNCCDSVSPESACAAAEQQPREGPLCVRCFFDLYIRARKPCTLRLLPTDELSKERSPCAALADSRALKCWSDLAYLTEAAGNEIIDVEVRDAEKGQLFGPKALCGPPLSGKLAADFPVKVPIAGLYSPRLCELLRTHGMKSRPNDVVLHPNGLISYLKGIREDGAHETSVLRARQTALERKADELRELLSGRETSRYGAAAAKWGSDEVDAERRRLEAELNQTEAELDKCLEAALDAAAANGGEAEDDASVASEDSDFMECIFLLAGFTNREVASDGVNVHLAFNIWLHPPVWKCAFDKPYPDDFWAQHAGPQIELQQAASARVRAGYDGASGSQPDQLKCVKGVHGRQRGDMSCHQEDRQALPAASEDLRCGGEEALVFCHERRQSKPQGKQTSLNMKNTRGLLLALTKLRRLRRGPHGKNVRHRRRPESLVDG
ncbi:hypothetical protein ACSSS7_003049 [Eimeria intestinalis]